MGSIRAGVVGLGYVGLPMCVAAVRAGFDCLGVDVDAKVVAGLNEGRSHIDDVPCEIVGKMVETRRFRATIDFRDLRDVHVILICVPTPIDKHKVPDLSFIKSAAEQVSSILRTGQLVVLESTSYPGTTEEVLRPILERSGLKAGVDFHLAFSPERIDPGNKEFRVERIPKIVGGLTSKCGDLAEQFYSRLVEKVVRVSSPRVAEMAKIHENIFRCVNIAYVNELALLCDRMGIDVWEVIDAASTKPFGFMPFYPGPGLGGHCIPVDPYYLAYKARDHDFHVRFVELAATINDSMPYFVVSRVADILGEAGKGLKNASVLVLGVSYKKDIADVRESPALKVMQILLKRGAMVSYHDPYVPKLTLSAPNATNGAPIGDQMTVESTPLDAQSIAAADCIVLITAHSCLPYDLIVGHSQAILDTRNALRAHSNGREVHRL